MEVNGAQKLIICSKTRISNFTACSRKQAFTVIKLKNQKILNAFFLMRKKIFFFKVQSANALFFGKGIKPIRLKVFRCFNPYFLIILTES